MNYGSNILDHIHELLKLFQPVCGDKSTINALIEMVKNSNKWPQAHALFSKIRLKTLKAENSSNNEALSQYRFEEICAKTLYNLSRSSAPFDPDSPYCILPNAFSLAETKGISKDKIYEIIRT